MGVLGSIGGFLKKAAPFIAAPFTGGLSIPIGMGIGAATGGLSGGWKGALMGGAMGAVPGMSGMGGVMGKIGKGMSAFGGIGGGGMPWRELATAGVGAGMAMLGNRKTSGEKGLEGMLGQYSSLSNMIGKYAQNQHSMAEPAITKAMQYYSTLAGGNRAQMGAAMAPEMGAMADTYKGATNSVMNTQVGAGRDRALAEIARQRAGQMAMMPMMARQNAVAKLGDFGMNLNNNVMNAYGQMGSNLYGMGNTYSQLANMQGKRNEGWAKMGENLGDILLPWVLGRKGGTPPTTVPGERKSPSPYPQLPGLF